MAAKKTVEADLTAKRFLKELTALKGSSSSDNFRFFTEKKSGTEVLNVRHGHVFSLAKNYTMMEPEQIEELLESDYYEARLGAVSIMDFRARDKKTDAAVKKELYKLYLGRHDRINNWDLVDRAAMYVVGGYLFDKPRDPLYKLAKSRSQWERRTAIVSTCFFLRQKQTDDTFRIAELLVYDKEELVNKAVGSWIREAGKRDEKRLRDFIERHLAKMPRVTLRYAVEKLDKKTKDGYMKALK